MSLPDGLRMRSALEADLPAIAALRASVGWAAHDWALRAVLVPPHARCLLVTDEAGEAVAAGSGISYGRLGFVGNMVVAESHRRRGIGAGVLEAIIDFLTDAGCVRLELFATAAGRPLYARHGFSLTDPSAMVSVPRATPLDGDAALEVDEADDPEDVAAYDLPRFGGDRRPLLEMMVRDDARPLLAARDASGIRGYLWLRGDGPRVGPFVADDPRAAATLLRAAFERVVADELILNVPTANRRGIEWLRALSIPFEPWDGRMGRGPAVPRRDETIYANVVGALG